MKKKLLLLLVCILAGALSAMALEAYVVYDSNTTTLTFCYGTRPQTGTTYSLNIGSDTPDWYKDNTCENVTKVVFDSSFGQVRPISTQCWFSHMTNLTEITGWQYLHTDRVTNMSGMFESCTSLTDLDLSSFSTSNVTSMSSMFNGCSKLTNLNLSSFNTSNVTSMNHMFLDCLKLQSLDLSSFNTSNVTNMIKMFKYCTDLTTIYVSSQWSTANVDASSEMFYECTSLVGGNGTRYDEDHINKTYARIDAPGSPGYFTEKLQPYVQYHDLLHTLLFYYASSPTQGQHIHNYSLNQPGGYSPDWFEDGTYENVTKVVFDPSFDEVRPTTTLMWFYGMANLTEITGWQYLHTDEVYQTNEMFWGCSSLTELDLSHFNTSNLRYMERMFANCTNLTTIYVGSGWTTAQASTYQLMFINCTNLVGGQGTTYDPDHVDVAYAHIDGGPSNPGYFTDINAQPEPYAVYNSNTSTLTFRYGVRPAGAYTLNTEYDSPGWITDHINQNVTKVVFDPSFENAYPTSTYCWFINMANLSEITGLEYLNTDSVTIMRHMFQGTNLTTLDLSHFNTGKLVNTYSMFNSSANLKTIYVGDGWTTANVTNSSYMFNGCTNLVGGMGTTYDANHIDKAYAHIDGGTSNPGYFSEKLQPYVQYHQILHTLSFYCASSPAHGNNIRNYTLESLGWFYDGTYQDVTRVVFDSSFDQARPTSTAMWFYDMANLTTITGWQYLHTDSVTDMQYMFYGCSSLSNLDVSNFNTSKVTNMASMFDDCENLETIYVSNGWNTSNVGNSLFMFSNCLNLVGGQGTTYDASHVDVAYAHIDGGTSNPGYLTAAGMPGDANGDGKVDVNDVTTTINYILSKNPSPFIFENANVNGDANINVMDVTLIINIILGIG